MYRLTLSVACAAILAGAVTAQMREFPFQKRSHAADSGHLANRALAATVVWSYTVRSPGAIWLRVRFAGATQLEGRSFVRLTSLKDGHFQLFEAWSLRDYRFVSSYFNGEAVRVELIAEPFTTRNRVVIEGLEHGQQPMEPLSQCGPTDDRRPSTDPRAARQFPTGCTTWLINKFAGCTAGHCTSNSSQTMQFNVPPSSSTGSIRHPPPSDQYPYDASSLRRLNAGVGQDWAVFATVRNSTHGMYAGEKQGSWFKVVRPGSSGTIRITGYGVDRDQRTRSQTQQTHTGPLSFLSGSWLCYRTDTEGGNSGSPVINEATGEAVGIHTHGGCRTSGSGCNSGTAILLRSDFTGAMNAVLAGRVAGCYDEFGSGCRGTAGTPKLENTTVGPEIGKTFAVRVSGLPSSGVGALNFGSSDTMWGPIRLPWTLPNGCTQYASVDFLLGFRAASGSVTWSTMVPADRQLIGATWFNQYTSIDLSANAAGFATSNAAKAVVGGLR